MGGWAILIGFVVSVAAFVLGLLTAAAGKRMVALGASIAGRPPSPEEAGQLQSLFARLHLFGRTNAVLVIIAVGTMASARFVG